KAVELGGMRITTTLDLELQEKAQEIVTSEIKKVENYHITNGASVVLDPQTGEILAMVGSKNYDDPDYEGKFNVVTQGLRQPGSAIKPVTYVTAFKEGYTPSYMLIDTLTSFPGGTGQPDYIPTNYDGKEHGPMQLRYALGNSINIAAVKMLAKVGIKDMLTVAFDLGISTLEPTKENLSRLGLSVTLGGGEVRMIELASAYSAFANSGLRAEPIAILKVTDKDGNVLEELKPIPGKRVLSEAEAFLISHILSDNSAREMTFGLSSLLKIANRQVAVKTGTTNDKRDNWAIGWTPQVLVAVWVGNNDNTSMKQVASGVSGATPIWRQTILEALKKLPVEEFKAPSGIVTAEVDTVSGYRAHDGFPQRTEYFIQGTEPVGEDPIHKKLKLCRAQGKLATPVDIARGDYDEKEYFIFKESDPFASGNDLNRWQKGIDDWLSKQQDPRYHPPTEYCSTTDQLHIVFESPGDRSQVGSNFTVKLRPVSTSDIKEVKVFINGQEKKVFNSRPYEFDVTLSDGTYTIKAEAKDEQNHDGSSEIKIGVNVPWDYTKPTVTPKPTSTPTSFPTPPPTATPGL
ncbi:hypothetical protein KKA69_03705, partial [Patescibacteria group bacterium]|nr:hypothetical protein [Patescibacteria group bacterium]